MGGYNRWEPYLIAALFLLTLWLWTLPIQQNPAPYGEVDAASHYAIADYTVTSGHSITSLPPYIDARYGNDNRYQPGTLWYPPPFHTMLALGSLAGGDRGLHIMNALLCSFFVLSVYFLIRRLYGPPAALSSALLLAFSMRDILIYLWGQWPERAGFSLLPLVLYSGYRTFTASEDRRPLYAILTAITLAINLYLHPMTFFHSALGLALFSAVMLVRTRRLPLSVKQLGIAGAVFIVLLFLFPSQILNVVVQSASGGGGGAVRGSIGRLFSWFAPVENTGVPSTYFSYADMLAPTWTVWLVLLGALALALRHRNQDLLLLAWLVSLYIMVHLDVLGIGRVHRSLSGTAHLFFPLMAIGVFSLPSLIPQLRPYATPIRLGGLGLLVVVVLAAQTGPAYQQLHDAYPGVARLNEDQLAFSSWLRSSDIPEDAKLRYFGSLSLAKTRWLWMRGHRYMATPEQNRTITHRLIDYSDFARIDHPQAQEAMAGLAALEEQLANQTLLYDSPRIRLYGPDQETP